MSDFDTESDGKMEKRIDSIGGVDNLIMIMTIFVQRKTMLWKARTETAHRKDIP